MESIYHGYTETDEQAQERFDKRAAVDAYLRIVRAVGKENADKMICREMLLMSWKDIRHDLELFADLAEKQAEERADAQEHADLYRIGMGG